MLSKFSLFSKLSIKHSKVIAAPINGIYYSSIRSFVDIKRHRGETKKGEEYTAPYEKEERDSHEKTTKKQISSEDNLETQNQHKIWHPENIRQNRNRHQTGFKERNIEDLMRNQKGQTENAKSLKAQQQVEGKNKDNVNSQNETQAHYLFGKDFSDRPWDMSPIKVEQTDGPKMIDLKNESVNDHLNLNPYDLIHKFNFSCPDYASGANTNLGFLGYNSARDGVNTGKRGVEPAWKQDDDPSFFGLKNAYDVNKPMAAFSTSKKDNGYKQQSTSQTEKSTSTNREKSSGVYRTSGWDNPTQETPPEKNDSIELIGYDRPAEIDPEEPGFLLQRYQNLLPEEFNQVKQKHANEIERFIRSGGKEKISVDLAKDLLETLYKVSSTNTENMEKIFSKTIREFRGKNLSSDQLVDQMKKFMVHDTWFHGGITHILKGLGLHPKSWENSLLELLKSDKVFNANFVDWQRRIIEKVFDVDKLSQNDKKVITDFLNKNLKTLLEKSHIHENLGEKVIHTVKDTIHDLGDVAKSTVKKVLGKRD